MQEELIIKNYENKIKELIKLQNQNVDSGDNSSFALNDFCERQQEIDRLNLCISLLKKE